MEANKPLTPIKAIRQKCLDCVCFQAAEVRRCPSISCPLYPYRMGHRPKNTGAAGAETDEPGGEG